MNGIKAKVRITKELFHKDDYYILSAELVESNRDIKLNQWGGFSLVGSLGYLTVDNTYEMILKEGKVTKYGLNYEVCSVPSLDKKQLDKLTDEEKFSIMRMATSSDKIATNILSSYPNFIDDVVMKSDEELDKLIDLKKIKGVGEVYYKAYKRILRDKFKYFNFIHRDKLQPYDLTVDDGKMILSYYVEIEKAEKEFINNPYYGLCELCKYSFKNADNLLKTIRGDLINSTQRCEALVMEILHRNETDGNSRLNGNTCFHVMASDEYNCGDLKNKIVETCEKSSNIYYDKETKDLSLFNTYMKENDIASYARSANINCNVLDFDVENYRTLDNGITLTDMQLNAVKNFKNYRLSNLVGFGGSGKTTSIQAIVKVCKDLQLSMTLLAPTGSASLRMTESTNVQASTIHLKCLRDRIIDTDVLLVDECSMIDLDTFSMMIRCIDNPNIRIVLIGDIAQIIPVGVGTVFADLVKSEILPTTILTQVFRYGDSGIAYSGANTRNGVDFFDNKEVKHGNNKLTIMNDWEFYTEDSDEKIAEKVIEQYLKLLDHHVKKSDILVLSAYNVGDCGTYILNNKIQEIINPPLKNEKVFTRKVSGFGQITFRKGDRVINKKNNYQQLTYDGWRAIEDSDGLLSEEEVETTVVFNGQRGDVIDILDKVMVVKFDNELVVYDKLQAHNLLLSYVITCHSSQGQESPYVINVVTPSQSRLMSRNLMYVANTRAKKHHINIGSIQSYKDALKIDGVEQRNTWLLDLLTNENTLKEIA